MWMGSIRIHVFFQEKIEKASGFAWDFRTLFETSEVIYGTVAEIVSNTASYRSIPHTVEPPLMDILYSGHLYIQDKMLQSRLNLHYV